MQETQKSSSKDPVTIEQLLQLKRLEKPADDFWAGFERELQQKQLQALVRPSLWARLRAAVASTPAHFAPVSTAVVFCATAGLFAFSFLGREEATMQIALEESLQPAADVPVMAQDAAASALTEVEAEEAVVLAPQTDFIEDTIVPELLTPSAESFRSYHVVSALTIGSPQPIGSGGGALEF